MLPAFEEDSTTTDGPKEDSTTEGTLRMDDPARFDEFGVPYAPVSPFLPILGPLAYFPMPVKFRIRFGEPLHFDGPSDDEDVGIDAKVDVVKARIDELIATERAARKGIF